MKISTWNVNGFRAVLRKGVLQEFIAHDMDVLCLQEVKARRDQLSDTEAFIPGYTCFWNPAEKPGYSGVVVYTRQEPTEVRFGMGEDRFDTEGRIIRLTYPNFLLYNVYFPSGQRGLDRVGYKLEFYQSLLNQLDDDHRKGNNIIVTGDFNTAHNEIDLANPKSNQKTSGFLPEERLWVQKYLEHGFVDVYRYRYPDRVQYTWWTYTSGARSRNVGWRIDYFLVSRALVEQVEDVIIHNEILGSDHCPVSLILKTPA